MTKKVVLKLGVHDEKAKQKALKAVSSLCGVESLAMDMNEKKLTIVGAVDPVEVVCKLKKWHTEILTVGPAKEPEKKEGPKKDDAKKDDGKKKESEQIEELLKLCKNYYYSYCTPYPVYSVEIPNACVPWCVHEHPCFF